MRLWPFNRGGDTRSVGFQFPKYVRRKGVDFDTAMSVSAFWACVRLLSEVIASMPLRAYNIEDGAKTITTDYPLWRRLFFSPNRYQTAVEFWENIVLNLVTYGNSFVTIERDRNGEIISLLPLASAQMDVKLLRDGSLTYVYTTADNSTRVYAESSIWHLKIFGNGIVGLSPLQYAAGSLNTADNLDKRMETLSGNGGKANGILTIDKALTDPQRKQIKENFKNLEQGPDAELFVLEAGFKYQQTSLSPSDMQLIENRRFQVEDIARFMGVPSVLINDTSAATTWGSGIQQITQGFYKLNLRPYLERIESSIQRHLMPREDWERITFEFDFDALVRADQATRIDAAGKAVNNGILTPNEARAQEGLAKQTGGDTLYLNGSLVPAGQPRREPGGGNNGA